MGSQLNHDPEAAIAASQRESLDVAAMRSMMLVLEEILAGDDASLQATALRMVHCFNQGRPFNTARAFNDLKRKMNTEEPSQ
mgnify:CR=1 FL=1